MNKTHRPLPGGGNSVNTRCARVLSAVSKVFLAGPVCRAGRVRGEALETRGHVS